MREVTVRELWIYPVKGCQGVAVEALSISRLGISGDRDFVLLDGDQLVDQKDTPIVASLAAGLDRERGVLRLEHPTQGVYEHAIRREGEVLDAKWVLDQFQTIDQGHEVAEWLSSVVEKPVRLAAPGAAWKINFPIPQFERVHDQEKQRFFAASEVSLGNQASLDDLNTRLGEPVGMDRFRLNVIVDGLDPYAEDEIESLSNDHVELLQVTPAERCIIINTDQKTGVRRKSDLLKVLGEYRRKPKVETFGSGIIFGNYMTVGREGTLRVGDRLIVS